MSEQPQEPVMPFIPDDKVDSEVEVKEPQMPFVAEEEEPEPKASAKKSKGSQTK